MKHIVHYKWFGMATALLAAGVALASDKSNSAQKPDAKMAEMMKKAEAAGAPGAAHKALEPLVGEWNAEVKIWMAPGAPPDVTRATAKSTWEMKGRFVREEFRGEFMGKPFHGLSFTGYDNIKQK